MKALLLDCGPIVALLDRGDSKHRETTARSGQLTGQVITTGPIITEAMFYLQEIPGGPERLVHFLHALRVTIEDVFDPASLTMASALMRKYADIPMDFADASLVIVGGRLGVGDILTLDERGFRTFRYGRSKSFHLLLQDD